jgi:two-component system, NtrC family, response regulator AtoC
LQALAESKNNVTEAARRLGISRRTLHRKLKELRHTAAEAATIDQPE